MFKCRFDGCEVELETRKGRAVHERVHTNHEVECTECGLKTRSQSGLTWHVRRVHSGATESAGAAESVEELAVQVFDGFMQRLEERTQRVVQLEEDLKGVSAELGQAKEARDSLFVEVQRLREENKNLGRQSNERKVHKSRFTLDRVNSIVGREVPIG